VGTLAASAVAALLAAAPGPGPAPAEPAPLALTISGAVSLGSYEAGLLHYLVETLRQDPGARELRLVTGASAGSVNGLLAVLQHCGAAPATPADSLFWRTWIDVGLQDFHLPAEATPLAAFSRRPLYTQAARIEDAWRGGLRDSCDVVVGISATRVKPRLVALAPEPLLLPRIDEQFTIRLQGRGPGVPPRITNYVDPAWRGEQLLLPEDPSGEVPFQALRDLLLASVAFPGAFDPQPLAHCVARASGGAPPRCPAAAAVTDLFLDGGLLDNTPLRSAVRLARAGLHATPGGGGAWADAPHLGAGALPGPLLFTYVSPAVTGYPSEDPPRRSERLAMLDHLSRVADAFVEAAFAKNLLALVEDDPAIGARVAVPVRSLPAAGSPLAAFFGFFEEEFRAFDFQLGMYEARRMASARLAPRVFPEQAGPAEAWRPLRCLRAVLDGDGAPAAACAGDDLADFRILLQTALERLWDRCAPENGDVAASAQRLCQEAWAGAALPRVPGVAPLGESSRRRPSESLVAHVMRLLVGHGFWFKDHGLSRGRAAEAPAALRRELVAIGKTVSGEQPVSDAVLLDTFVALAADNIVYVPPRNSLWLAFGRDVELGGSHGFFDAFREGRWFRFHGAVQMNRLGQAISSDPGPKSLTLLGGAELLPPRISTSRFQLGALLRGGWQLSSRDRWGAIRCPDPDTDTLGVCSRPVLQAGVVGALFERIRLHFLAGWYPPYHSTRRALWALSPAAGLEWTF
jgi:predicted acylesterase/phospholipase RssA